MTPGNSGWSSRKTVREAADAVTRCEEGIAEDAEDPRFEVGASLKGVEGAQRFGDGLLHKVFRVRMIAAEPEGKAVERGKRGSARCFAGLYSFI